MKIPYSNLKRHIGLLAAMLLATGAAAQVRQCPTLKDAYKDHFYVGVAINRSIATGEARLRPSDCRSWSRKTLL